MDVRIVAILVGVAITFIIQNGLDARWYISVPAGIVGYVVARSKEPSGNFYDIARPDQMMIAAEIVIALGKAPRY
jgi:hypothetical protein